MLRLSKEKIDNIKALLESGYSYNEITKRCKVSVASVSRIKLKYLAQLPYSTAGRKKVLTDKDISHRVRLMTSGKIKTVTKLRKDLMDNYNINVSERTLRRRLNEAGLKATHRVKKPN